jgi:energy-coupling factor transport system substrate-specific component
MKTGNWAGSRKLYQLVLFVVACVLLNYGGKRLAIYFSLPLWLDAFGTILSAYMLGPVWGAGVGVSVNILYGYTNPVSYVYALTSLAIGVCVGWFAERRFFDSFFQTLSVSALVAAISTIISTILNQLLYDGMTGNMWGDGVIAFLRERDLPELLCDLIGEFYIDFLDKVLTLLILYMIVSRKQRAAMRAEGHRGKTGGAGTLLAALAFAGILSWHTPVQADYTSYVQTIYNNSSGLPCGEANDIAQTSDGILWIGTYSGLYRCNGSEIEWKDEFESIKNVNCLFVDDEDRLWIGTNDNGFSICIREKISGVIEEADGLSSNSVRCIVQSADGRYYIGTTGCMQIVSITDDGVKFLNNIEEVNYAVCAAADEADHVVTVDTNGYVYLIEHENVIATLVPEDGQAYFSTCTFDKEGVLYVGNSANDIYVYDISGGEFQETDRYSAGGLQTINNIYFPETGGTYICADNGVGYMDDEWNYTEISTGQFNNSIDKMTIDYQGNLWFASSRLGVLQLCKSSVVDYYGALGVESDVVNTSEFWNDMLYVGTDSGLDVLDIQNKTAVTNFLTRKLDGIRIRCIKADSKNHLWICTYGSGLWEVDGDTITTYNTTNGTFGDRARAVIELSDGTIVAAGDNGITFIEDGKVTQTFTYGTGLSNAMILSLMEMPDGRLMAGTDGDGIVIIRDGSVQKTLTREDGLSSGVILRTVVDSAGDGIFVVTSNGLCYVEADDSVRTLDNFPYFNNYDIWESAEGRLYVLGSAGIYVVDRDELMSGEEVSYSLLDAQTGLTSSITVNSWNTCTDGTYLYFACDTGVYGIPMTEEEKDAVSYRIRVVSVALDQETCEPDSGTPLEIGRDVKKIEIVPEVINFTTEDPYISYYLEGFDDSPSVVKESELGSLVYTNVPPGSYTFSLKVLDDDQKTVLEEVSYQLVKTKAIYDRVWFIAYMIFVPAMFVSWLTCLFIRRHIQQTLNRQSQDLELARRQIEMGNQAILTIAKTVDAKDVNTSRHSQRVSEYAVMIAKELGQSDEECELLRKTALLHDIGKIGIPDRVLNKPGRLTDEEYELMKSHVTKGAAILKDFTVVNHVWEGALYHHEQYDGSGYMMGLKGEEIPLNARIIGLADAFDAMTANRIYRKKLDLDYVINELKKGSGSQFDPYLTDILLNLIYTEKLNVEALYSDSGKEEENEPK